MADYTKDSTEDDPVGDVEILTSILKKWRRARDFSSDWRKEARENYEFVALRQWSQEDLSLLNEQDRPALTFDYTGKVVNAVAGAEVNNRQQVKYVPREISDVKVNEMLTAAGDWVRDQCQAEDEESDAFRDVLTAGMGWTDTLMDYDENPDGDVIIERRDPMLMWWDPAAKKRNLRDMRHVFYGDWMPKTDVEDKWPDADLDTISADLLSGETVGEHNADEARFYRYDQSGADNRPTELFVVQYQCLEKEEFYRALDPESGKIVSFDKDRFATIKSLYKKATGLELKSVKQTKNVYYRAFFVGNILLEYEKAPIQTGFTFNAITGRRDRNTNTWIGIVSALKDPQRWGNKWLSQVLHIINSNAKGGALAETGAFQDPRKAEEQWAQAAPLILMREGGIAKIKERQPAPFPAGLERLMEFAFNAGPMVSGINLEALGLANRDQPGVLESQRKQSAYAMVADLFDALRLYRKMQGAILLEYIREFISDGRLMRITGPEGVPQVVQLLKQPDTITYDVIVDSAPHSPDSKEKTWEMLTQILPTMMKQGLPIPPDLLDFSPLPSTLVDKWKAYIASSKQLPPQAQQQMDQLQQELQQLGQQNQQLQQENMQLKFDGAVEMLHLQQKASANAQNVAVKEKAITADSFNRQLETMTKAAIDRLDIMMNARVKDMQSAIDAHATLLDHGRQISEAKADGSASQKMDSIITKLNDAQTSLADTVKVLKKPRKTTIVNKKTGATYDATTE